VTALRARYDSWHDAGRWRAILLGAVPDPRLDRSIRWDADFLSYLDRHDEARPGDVWIFRRRPAGPNVSYSYREPTPMDAHWPVAGYGLVCPIESCRYGVHAWEHAHNCPANDTFGADCKRGAGRISCWDWSGSIEGGDLTANPSLQVLPSKDPVTDVEYPPEDPRQSCRFHGWLRAGVVAP
jgi:hypothetical protein